jgi:intracellular sulfur oxidation DsrE/DsrF family protein
MKQTTLGLMAVVFCATTYAAEPYTGPVFSDYGPVYDIAEPDLPVDVNAHFRLIFDALEYSADGEGINRSLARIASFMNMFARAGVPVDHMDFVVVLHGPGLKSGLVDDAYEKRYGRKNPNLDLIQQLASKSVRFVACGQSMMHQGFGRDELAGPIEVALSASAAFAILQKDGYSTMP